MKNISVLFCMTLLVTGLAMADNPVKDATTAGTAVPGGGSHPAVEGTAWLIYDDGSAESDSAAYFTPGVEDLAGNKFTSSWGTFYCDIVDAYFVANNSSFYLTYFSALTAGGSNLTGDNFVTINLPGSTASAWWLVDGTITAVDWIGNSASGWVNTAYIGNDFNTSDVIGIDTNGTPQHGFSLTSWTGAGYVEGPFNAMIRARFNGELVPVELMTFTAE